MSYSRRFKPPKEVIEKYKSKEEKGYLTSELQSNAGMYDILSWCIKEVDDNPTPFLFASRLHIELKSFAAKIKEGVKNSIYENWLFEGVVSFHGWEYSKENFDNEEEIINYYLEELFTVSFLVKTPNFFTDEDSFYAKKHKILELIENFKETITTLTNHQIIQELLPYEIKDNDEEEEEEGEERAELETQD